jgi:hypothetical protein
MQVVVENAGAEKGALILLEGEALAIAANMLSVSLQPTIYSRCWL